MLSILHLKSVFAVLVYFIAFVSNQTYGQLMKDSDTPCELLPNLELQFYRISAISKFIGFTSSVKNNMAQTYYEAKQICESGGLEIADVHSFMELQSLKSYVNEPYWIGMNSLKGLPTFQDGKGRDIQYQSFGLGDPDLPPGYSCVQLRGYFVDNALRMFDESCSSKAGVLCQYPEKSYCSGQSFQQIAKNTLGGYQELVRLATSSQIYVSTVQRTFDDAIRSCVAANKIPLYIYNKEMSKDLADALKAHTKQYDLDPQTQFWTGGTVDYNEDGHFSGTIYWDVIDVTYNLYFNRNNVSYEWALGEPKGLYPSDIPTMCIDVANNKEGYGSIWQSSNCLMPKFYLCVDSNWTVSQQEFALRQQKIINEEYNGTYVPKRSSHPGRLDVAGRVIEEDDNALNAPICTQRPIKQIDPITIQNLTGPLTPNQTLSIMMYVAKNNLKYGVIKVKTKKNLTWMREIIDKVFSIFMKAIPTEIVPWEMMDVAREVNILYQLALRKDKDGMQKSEKDKMMDWESVLAILDVCEIYMHPYDFATNGLRVTHFRTYDQGVVTLIPQMEEADVLHIDLIVDILWHVFSFSLGACYPSGTDQNPVMWASEYYILFLRDILDKIMNKWFMEDAANVIKAGLILGDIDLVNAMNNLRAVTVAAYMQNHILDRQMVRPVHARDGEIDNDIVGELGEIYTID